MKLEDQLQQAVILNDNLHSEGVGNPVHPEVLKKAETLVQLIEENPVSFGKPYIIPSSHGDIAFEWFVKDHRWIIDLEENAAILGRYDFGENDHPAFIDEIEDISVEEAYTIIVNYDKSVQGKHEDIDYLTPLSIDAIDPQDEV